MIHGHNHDAESTQELSTTDLWTLYTTQDDMRQIGLDIVVPAPIPTPSPDNTAELTLTAEIFGELSTNLAAYANRDTAIARFAALQARARPYSRLYAIVGALRSHVLGLCP